MHQVAPMPGIREPVDLLVIGGGVAGLTAAAWVAGAGGTVTVVEASPELGGAGRLAGFLWTTPSLQEFRRINPEGDPELARVFLDGFPEALSWVRSSGVSLGPPVTILRYGLGYKTDVNGYLDRCVASLRSAGAQVLTDARATSLWRDGRRVAGAICEMRDGTTIEIASRSTLLSTGGFQADAALLEEWVHPRAHRMPLRSRSWSAGGGFRLGTALGAGVGLHDAGFYGHLVPAGARMDNPSSFTDATMYYSEHGLLFNLEGKRFTDETEGDHCNAIAVLEQPEGRAMLIADADVHEEWMIRGHHEGIPAVDKFAIATRIGRHVGVANTLAELLYLPPEWGYPGAALKDGIELLNRDIATGREVPSRTYDRRSFGRAPYYLVEVEAAVTFPFAGLRIDVQGRVCDGTGHVIPGLYCAGSDAGGLYHRAYAGGIAPAIVFGIIAARSALSDAGDHAHVSADSVAPASESERARPVT